MRHKISYDSNMQRARTESSFYRKDNNELDTEKLFFDFLLNIYEILPTLKVSPGMKPLSADFTPCLRCMNTSGSRPETVRCRHRVDCQVHDDSCNCRDFTSPSLTHTRSGAVLHLEWIVEGEAKFNIDADLVPILPTSTPYDGEITSVTNALASERPVGWLDELDKVKVENMADAVHLPHLKSNQKWHLNMRLMNRNTVMPRQVISSMGLILGKKGNAPSLLPSKLNKVPCQAYRLYGIESDHKIIIFNFKRKGECAQLSIIEKFCKMASKVTLSLFRVFHLCVIKHWRGTNFTSTLS